MSKNGENGKIEQKSRSHPQCPRADRRSPANSAMIPLFEVATGVPFSATIICFMSEPVSFGPLLFVGVGADRHVSVAWAMISATEQPGSCSSNFLSQSVPATTACRTATHLVIPYGG